MHILIVEDELLIAEMLKEMLIELNYKVVGIAKNYVQAITNLKTHKTINLCFLDINLENDLSGFDVAREMNTNYSIPFVFLTSYSDATTIKDAVELKPEAYLVKPFSSTDLLTTIEIIRARMKNQSEKNYEKYIIIKDGSLNVKINISDIKWLKSENIYVEIITPEKTYLIRNSLEKILEDIHDSNFVRTHRSFAVNLNYVNAVNGQQLIIGTEKIPLSRKHRDEIKRIFND